MDHWKKYRILIYHQRWPGSIDEQPTLNIFVSVEMLVVALKLISCSHIQVDGVSRMLRIEKQLHQHHSKFWKFHNNWQIDWNKDHIQLIFISSCCLKFGTTVRLFWKSFSYLWDGRMRDFILSLASFLQCMNSSFCASGISLTLATHNTRQ